MPNSELTIKCARLDHKGKARLTVCLHDDVLAVNTINLTDARARAGFSTKCAATVPESGPLTWRRSSWNWPRRSLAPKKPLTSTLNRKWTSQT